MGADPAIKVPVGKSRMRIKSLMIWVALIAAGLGWMMHTERTRRALRADQAIFVAWTSGFRADHPEFKPLGWSVRAESLFLEMGRSCRYEFQGPSGHAVVITANLRSGPFHVNRRVTFESPSREVTWPFEDVERGRKIDPKAEFPGASR